MTQVLTHDGASLTPPVARTARWSVGKAARTLGFVMLNVCGFWAAVILTIYLANR